MIESLDIIINISTSLVVGGGAGFTVFKFLGEKWVEGWFAKELEQYKHQLEMMKIQKQLQFSNIYIERANIIKELYILLGKLIQKKQIIKELNSIDQKYERELYAEYGELLQILYLYIMENGIYLPQSTSDKLAEFAEIIVKEIALKRYEYGDVNDDYVRRINNIPDNDLPTIFRSLRSDFKELLGMDD